MVCRQGVRRSIIIDRWALSRSFAADKDSEAVEAWRRCEEKKARAQEVMNEANKDISDAADEAKNDAQKIGQKIKKATEKAKEGSKGMWDTNKDCSVNKFAGMKDKAADAAKDTKTGAQTVGQKIKETAEWVKESAKDMKEKVQKNIHKMQRPVLKDNTYEGVEPIRESAKDTKKAERVLQDDVKEKNDQIREKANEIKEKMINKFIEIKSEVSQAAKDAANKIYEGVKPSDKKSPIKVGEHSNQADKKSKARVEKVKDANIETKLK